MPFIVTTTPPKDRSYGILTSTTPIFLEDPHWQSGIEWESDCSVEMSSTILPCPEVTGSKEAEGGLTLCSATPFTVVGSYKCPPVGSLDARKIASNRLKKNKEREIEEIFWTGTTSVGEISPSLQGGNDSCGDPPVDLTPDSGALSPVAAIAALESNIADCIPGGLGTIHVNFGVLPYLAANTLLVEKDGKYYTPSGQLIIAGAGYPGSGPGNVAAAAGESWIFATGPVSVFHSDVFFTSSTIEAVDRSLNNVTVYAEQTYSVVWECCLFGVRVSLC